MIEWQDGDVRVLLGDALSRLRELPDESVHCCVTSPPYWGLRAYLPDDHESKHLELGLEPTPEMYVAHLVDVFREVRRVLRADGTAWLNIGESYAHTSAQPNRSDSSTLAKWGHGGRLDSSATAGAPARELAGLKPKDLCMIPARVALALQADGWWLRSDIAWAKTAPMPESVRDRPTSAWEHIFLLAKSPTYYYDAEAVREPDRGTDHRRGVVEPIPSMVPLATAHAGIRTAEGRNGTGANMRNYWLLGPEPYPDAHFSVFPSEIPRRAIAAGTSERGCCPECGAPWVRCVERTDEPDPLAKGSRFDLGKTAVNGAGRTQAGVRLVRVATGWRPGCAHDHEPIPAVALDPFAGSGTTLAVARRLGRAAVGVELQADYLPLIQRRVRHEVHQPSLELVEHVAEPAPPPPSGPVCAGCGRPAAEVRGSRYPNGFMCVDCQAGLLEAR